ncbi:MAG: FAD:protein FMN transferase [Acidimicrobiia bacterium]|nr:FAD:protein FMN transferase [Acidimicrobiia bacterium]
MDHRPSARRTTIRSAARVRSSAGLPQDHARSTLQSSSQTPESRAEVLLHGIARLHHERAGHAVTESHLQRTVPDGLPEQRPGDRRVHTGLRAHSPGVHHLDRSQYPSTELRLPGAADVVRPGAAKARIWSRHRRAGILLRRHEDGRHLHRTRRRQPTRGDRAWRHHQLGPTPVWRLHHTAHQLAPRRHALTSPFGQQPAPIQRRSPRPELERAPPLGIPSRQRALRRLQRRPQHAADADLPCAAEPIRRCQGHAVAAVLVMGRVRLAGRVGLVGIAALLLTGCSTERSSPHAGAPPVERVGLAMGSQLRVRVFSSDPESARSAFDAVFAEFDRLDRLLSVWKDGSDVQRINGAAGVDGVTVSEDTIAVLNTARRISEWTEGAFDVTFGALSDVWRFDHDQDNRVPTREQIEARHPLVNYRAVRIDEPGHTVLLEKAGMRIHLGGIGKGYAVERSAALLRDRGYRDFMIQSGGDLYVAGFSQGQPWRLGVADPRKPTQSFGTLDLSDGTFSTSGDYERSFVKDGIRYHHLIDPSTGYPAKGTRSVTVVTNRPVLADGLSTGVFILGPARGMALVERLPDVEAVIVTDSNQVLVSSGLQGRFTQIGPPTDTP